MIIEINFLPFLNVTPKKLIIDNNKVIWIIDTLNNSKRANKIIGPTYITYIIPNVANPVFNDAITPKYLSGKMISNTHTNTITNADEHNHIIIGSLKLLFETIFTHCI